MKRKYFKCNLCLDKDDHPCIITLIELSTIEPSRCPFLDAFQKTNWTEITKEEFIVEVTNGVES